MTKQKRLIFNILISVLIFLIQYNGDCTIKPINATPMLPLGFVVVLSMFMSELSAFFLGLTFGILIDSVSVSAFGFNALFFPFVCVCVSLLVRYLFNNNFKSSAVLTASISFIYFTMRFLIFFSSVDAKDTLTYLIGTAFPSTIITAVFSIAFYFIEKRFFANIKISR